MREIEDMVQRRRNAREKYAARPGLLQRGLFDHEVHPSAEVGEGEVRDRGAVLQRVQSSELRPSDCQCGKHGKLWADYPHGFWADVAIRFRAGSGCFAAVDSVEGAVYVLT